MQAYVTRWIFMALIYLLGGVTLGVYMGASHDYLLKPVHAHINLLGWATMALTGLIYHHFPAAGSSRLANAHFWIYSVAVPVLLMFLALLLRGNAALEPVVAVASVVVLLSLVLFAVNVFMHRS